MERRLQRSLVGLVGCPASNDKNLAGLLKRGALLFDVLAIHDVQGVIGRLYHDGMEDLSATLEWLLANGVIWDVPELDDPTITLHPELSEALMSLSQKGEQIRNQFLLGTKAAKNAAILHAWSSWAFIQRAMAVQLCEAKDVDATPVFDAWALDGISSGRDTVFHVVMHAMPEPDERTPWEIILEFRKDPVAMSKLRLLRRWATKMGGGHPSTAELAEELTYLAQEYKDHLKLHRMKINSGLIETLLTVTAEAAESLLKLKFTSLSKLPFVLKHRRIALIEAERSAPGREIAFLINAHDKFSTSRAG